MAAVLGEVDDGRRDQVLALVAGRQARAEERHQRVAALEGDILDDERGVVGPQVVQFVPLLIVEQLAVPADQVLDLLPGDEAVERVHSEGPAAGWAPALDSRRLATNLRNRASSSGAG